MQGLICNKKKIQRLKQKIYEFTGTKMMFKPIKNYTLFIEYFIIQSRDSNSRHFNYSS
jgi:hypothetical protein